MKQKIKKIIFRDKLFDFSSLVETKIDELTEKFETNFGSSAPTDEFIKWLYTLERHFNSEEAQLEWVIYDFMALYLLEGMEVNAYIEANRSCVAINYTVRTNWKKKCKELDFKTVDMFMKGKKVVEK